MLFWFESAEKLILVLNVVLPAACVKSPIIALTGDGVVDLFMAHMSANIDQSVFCCCLLLVTVLDYCFSCIMDDLICFPECIFQWKSMDLCEDSCLGPLLDTTHCVSIKFWNIHSLLDIYLYNLFSNYGFKINVCFYPINDICI